tara:strand:- start:137 stop:469 length:333 start_codon:yes stop_codon:yes gene_type:complete
MKDPIENKSQDVETPEDVQDQLPGCAIALIGIFLFVVGVGIFIFGVFAESILFLLLGVLIGIFIAGFFLIYPFIRFLFGGKDSIAVGIATVLLEGWITTKVSKEIRKKRK